MTQGGTADDGFTLPSSVNQAQQVVKKAVLKGSIIEVLMCIVFFSQWRSNQGQSHDGHVN